jgi:hypothetical protein
LAPEFRQMRVVHELMMIRSVEIQFQASIGNGHYVDPALLAASPDRAPMPGLSLPAEFALPSRGGYRFEFSGDREGRAFMEEFNPAYASFVYVATPEPGQSEHEYTFALYSDTGRIHYATDGRVPTPQDPSVTDRVAAEAPERIKEIEAQPNEDSLMTRLRNTINSFLGSALVRDSELAFHEDRALKDLRAFAAAQHAFLAMTVERGYGSPVVLSEPTILPGVPPLPPFLDRSFLQDVREGYHFTFEGDNPTSGTGAATLYRDYRYAAQPVGDGPANRRSFAVYSDGVIRVRSDAEIPERSDPFLDSNR